MRERCETCGAWAETDPDLRAASENALAHVMALMRRPAGLALLEQTLRHLQALRGAGARLVEFEEERAALGR